MPHASLFRVQHLVFQPPDWGLQALARLLPGCLSSRERGWCWEVSLHLQLCWLLRLAVSCVFTRLQTSKLKQTARTAVDYNFKMHGRLGQLEALGSVAWEYSTSAWHWHRHRAGMLLKCATNIISHPTSAALLAVFEMSLQMMHEATHSHALV